MEIPLIVDPVVLWPDPEAGPWRLRFLWANVDGWSRLIGLDMRGFEGSGFGPTAAQSVEPLTADLLHRVPLWALAEQALGVARDALTGPASGDGLLGGEPVPKGRPRLPVEGPDGLRRVADIYRFGGPAPVLAVAHAFTISRDAAKFRVRRAREAGLL